jgi:hypothetical protein
MGNNVEDKKRKTVIIERIFERRWNPETGSLLNDLVTIDDIKNAVDAFDKNVPKGLKPFGARYNVYAFFKDFVRGPRPQIAIGPHQFLVAATRPVKRQAAADHFDLSKFLLVK